MESEAPASAERTIDEGVGGVNLASPAGIGESCGMETEPPRTDSPRTLVTLASFRHPFQADAVRMALEQAGIRAYVANANMANLNWGVAMADGGASVQVAAEDVDQAKSVLEEFQRGYEETRRDQAGGSCPACGCAAFRVKPRVRPWGLAVALTVMGAMLYARLVGPGLMLGIFLLPLAIGYRRQCRDCAGMW